jgi:hypothetical protein
MPIILALRRLAWDTTENPVSKKKVKTKNVNIFIIFISISVDIFD